MLLLKVQKHTTIIMAYNYSDSRSSSFSLSRDDWSFRSTSSSNNSNNSITTSTVIPCVSHPHYNCVASLKTKNHHHITCLAVHDNLLYAASGDNINVFDLSTSSLISPPLFNGHDLSSGGFIKSIAFHVDKILTAHQDGKIRVWKRHRLVATLPTMKDKLSKFLSPKNYIQVRRHKKKLWIQHNDAVSGLAVKSKTRDTCTDMIYSVSWDKTVKVWRPSDFKCVESFTAHDDAVNCVTVSGHGTVFTGSADGRIRVWVKRSNDRVGRHHMVATLEKHKSTVNALALSDDGEMLVSGGCDGVIMTWRREKGGDWVCEGVGEHDGAVLCLIKLDGCDLFVSGSADRTVKIWGRGERGMFCCLGVLEGHKRPVRSLVMAKLEKERNGVVSVCSGSLDGEIKVWEIMVNELIKFRFHNSMQGRLDNV